MTRTSLSSFVMACALLASCATTQTAAGGSDTASEPSLPNGTPQTATALPMGIEVGGILGCGQVAWYRLIVTDARPITMTVLGQALESALGATATVTFVAPTGQELGNMVLPVFARAPNWDPREQSFVPPMPGTYLARVTLDANGCQRVHLRMTLR